MVLCTTATHALQYDHGLELIDKKTGNVVLFATTKANAINLCKHKPGEEQSIIDCLLRWAGPVPQWYPMYKPQESN